MFSGTQTQRKQLLYSFVLSFINSLCLLDLGMPAPLNKIKYIKTCVTYIIFLNPLTKEPFFQSSQFLLKDPQNISAFILLAKT